MSGPFTAPARQHEPIARRRRGVLRITVRLLTGTSLLVGGALLTVLGIAERRARTHYEVPEHRLVIPTEQTAIERGARLAQVRGCVDCHGEGLGGRVMAEAPPIGRLAPPNLTNGRAPQALTDREWERAVRHGVRGDGTPLRIMPSHEFTQFTDEDLAAIIAYTRRLPGSASPVPPTTIGPLLKVLDVADQVVLYPASRIDHRTTHVAQLVPAPSADYGRYMTTTCIGCHGAGFSGGKIPGMPPEFPPAANITPTGIGHYSLEDLTRLLRTGVRPDGSTVNEAMPWKSTRYLDDTEIAAMYAFLKTVAPREYGRR